MTCRASEKWFTSLEVRHRFTSVFALMAGAAFECREVREAISRFIRTQPALHTSSTIPRFDESEPARSRATSFEPSWPIATPARAVNAVERAGARSPPAHGAFERGGTGSGPRAALFWGVTWSVDDRCIVGGVV
jgi:hypothetical protein